jgi:uncharacterized membrane protein
MVRTIWSITAVMVVIGIAIVVLRSVRLLAASPDQAALPARAGLDAGFLRHRVLTMLHILPGLVFITLSPLQFVRGLRSRRPRLHRWMGRAVLVAGAIIGGTALVMSPQMAIGGPIESAATTLYGALFLFALLQGFLTIRRGNAARHREWMIRGFAIGSAVTTTRPIVGFFFATSRITHWTPHDFFGPAFWLGFTVQAIAAEAWIHYTRTPKLEPAAAH